MLWVGLVLLFCHWREILAFPHSLHWQCTAFFVMMDGWMDGWMIGDTLSFPSYLLPALNPQNLFTYTSLHTSHHHTQAWPRFSCCSRRVYSGRGTSYHSRCGVTYMLYWNMYVGCGELLVI